MSRDRGIPASEEAELRGLLYRADQARADLGASTAPLARLVADSSARRRWLRHQVVSAVRGRARAIPGRAWVVAAAVPAAVLVLALAWRLRDHYSPLSQ